MRRPARADSELNAKELARRQYQRQYQRKLRLDPIRWGKAKAARREYEAQMHPHLKLAQSRRNYAGKLRSDPLYNLKRRARNYGMTLDEFNALLDYQGGGCAICQSTSNLRVDHCHSTGRVRGILCGRHNSALGLMGDNIESLSHATRYLEEANEQDRR